MIWYRLNINYLSKDYDNKVMEISEPLGDNEQQALFYIKIIKEYYYD